MYIWTGFVLDKEDELFIRNTCKEVNKKYGLNELSFTLPQHISLKTSFYSDNYLEVIHFIKSILSNFSAFSVNVIGISKINNGVIWLDIEENEILRNIHNLLNDELLAKYTISLIKFDGEAFKFHSTLFQDSSITDEHNSLIIELSQHFHFPMKLTIHKVSIGISEVGGLGTFKVFDTIELKGGIVDG